MKQSLEDLLRATSRSFYLTLRVLTRAVRSQISLAYLLARTGDTIADTQVPSLDQRLAALRRFRSRLCGEEAASLDLRPFAREQKTAAEALLLERVEEALAALETCSPRDQELVREVLMIILSGQELDLVRFGASAAALGGVPALKTDAELDDYTYRVAGCVGEFWTRLCRAHLFPQAPLRDEQLLSDAVRFGKGLQLVNILRDLPADLGNGRCYLPQERLEALGLQPETLLSPRNEAMFLPLYREYLDRAEAHLAAGWEYTLALPFSQFRVRLACAWPILIGAKTIAKLRSASVNELRQRVKVSRAEVRGIVARSVLTYALPFWWRKLFSPDRSTAASRAASLGQK
jgi:farnesyl-diphosphate farnesyltransferase